jgi:shikimate dehydrogenase
MHVTAAGLPDAVAGIRAMEFIGVNVTIPHKVAIVPLLDRLDVDAERIGAVNTVVNNNGVLTGFNTDGIGFIDSLEEALTPDYPDLSVLIFGAGGAARAIGLALAEKGVKAINIVNRSTARADEFKELLNRTFPALPATVRELSQDYNDLVAACKLVINATSLGMESRLKGTSFTVDRITEEHIVCDAVYSTRKTPLLIAAGEHGATTLGGLGMLLHQGAKAILLWSGKKPPLHVMRRAIEPERTDIKKEP